MNTFDVRLERGVVSVIQTVRGQVVGAQAKPTEGAKDTLGHCRFEPTSFGLVPEADDLLFSQADLLDAPELGRVARPRRAGWLADGETLTSHPDESDLLVLRLAMRPQFHGGRTWLIGSQKRRAKVDPVLVAALRSARRIATGAGLIGDASKATAAPANAYKRRLALLAFRSTFRDWASETTGFSHEVCEMALAHTIANKAEAAYRRGDLFDKRRKLMEAWAGYCSGGTKQKVSRIISQRPAST